MPQSLMVNSQSFTHSVFLSPIPPIFLPPPFLLHHCPPSQLNSLHIARWTSTNLRSTIWASRKVHWWSKDCLGHTIYHSSTANDTWHERRTWCLGIAELHKQLCTNIATVSLPTKVILFLYLKGMNYNCVLIIIADFIVKFSLYRLFSQLVTHIWYTVTSIIIRIRTCILVTHNSNFFASFPASHCQGLLQLAGVASSTNIQPKVQPNLLLNGYDIDTDTWTIT